MPRGLCAEVMGRDPWGSPQPNKPSSVSLILPTEETQLYHVMKQYASSRLHEQLLILQLLMILDYY